MNNILYGSNIDIEILRRFKYLTTIFKNSEEFENNEEASNLLNDIINNIPRLNFYKEDITWSMVSICNKYNNNTEIHEYIVCITSKKDDKGTFEYRKIFSSPDEEPVLILKFIVTYLICRKQKVKPYTKSNFSSDLLNNIFF